MANLNEPDFSEQRPGGARRARVGRDAGSERLGLSVWEVPAGASAYDYHWHVIEEEMVIVLSGRPTLRTPEGTRELAPGEVVAFRTGEQGAHQLLNESEKSIRFASISSATNGPEICFYPDLDSVGVLVEGNYTIYGAGDAAGSSSA
jgi:uncharacterized cupin superfamily protein